MDLNCETCKFWQEDGEFADRHNLCDSCYPNLHSGIIRAFRGVWIRPDRAYCCFYSDCVGSRPNLFIRSAPSELESDRPAERILADVRGVGGLSVGLLGCFGNRD